MSAPDFGRQRKENKTFGEEKLNIRNVKKGTGNKSLK